MTGLDLHVKRAGMSSGCRSVEREVGRLASRDLNNAARDQKLMKWTPGTGPRHLPLPPSVCAPGDSQGFQGRAVASTVRVLVKWSRTPSQAQTWLRFENRDGEEGKEGQGGPEKQSCCLKGCFLLLPHS